MARLTGPLFSLAASGTIAQTLTYSRWKGIYYVRTRVVPANPQSTGQVAVRNIFTNLNEMWKRMPSYAKESFTASVRGVPMTARNRFIQACAALLQGQGDLDLLEMGVSSGQAIEMDDVVWADGADGTATFTSNAPPAPTGYTLIDAYGLACLDGDPEEIIIRPWYYDGAGGAPWAGAVDVPADGDYQCGLVAVWQRDADSTLFYSVATLAQVAVTGN